MFCFCCGCLVDYILDRSQGLNNVRMEIKTDSKERRRRRKSEEFKQVNYISSRVDFSKLHVPKALMSRKIHPTLRYVEALPKLVSFESCVFRRQFSSGSALFPRSQSTKCSPDRLISSHGTGLPQQVEINVVLTEQVVDGCFLNPEVTNINRNQAAVESCFKSRNSDKDAVDGATSDVVLREDGVFEGPQSSLGTPEQGKQSHVSLCDIIGWLFGFCGKEFG